MHHHAHGHCDHHHGHHHGREGNQKGLAIALGVTIGIMVLEFVGGLVTNSLALLSDSGHMLSDAISLLLSLAAVWLAAKPASPKRTYGFYRFEILAALVNGVTLVVIAAWIIWEAVGRFVNPPAVASGPMMAVAAVGLLANLVSAWVLMRKGDVKENVNVRSAYLHVIGDALGSVGAMAAGLVIWLFDWYAADPLISIAVAVLILKGAFAVVKQTVHILMEGTPAAIDHAEVKAALSGIDGVIDVHDLHIWTITSGLDSLSCHLLIEEGCDGQAVLQRAIDLVETRFHIRHATIQIEMPHIRHGEMEV
ncbi:MULTISPECIES: cation diffusion facilitator family transporter [Geobacillus]|uniref:Cation efflux transporter n=4 Tax=Geobacillus thermoleovorans group TaxID=1505648 RepID=Q5L044_GEOKA|nr:MULTISPECIES: cation diffusion facilitator family transporter [Geobacillus]AEV18947.1 Cation diffusion facilitator family transporter [Geobacillus thermoleovorans CCB_US3_UF5]AMV10644.1 zinc transporter ZitB [Geobacillus thermoleovorans]AWO73121.1 cation transporter [Geobacillus thermoleovorans]AWO76321.1 cation transporter [Geobacillus thermoleovorans]EQB94167.1 cation transporter [Geobacillus sp. A8]